MLTFLDGLSPETIVAEGLPVLMLEQIYGAIRLLLTHRDGIDAYLTVEEAAFDVMSQPLQSIDLALYNKLMAAKAEG